LDRVQKHDYLYIGRHITSFIRAPSLCVCFIPKRVDGEESIFMDHLIYHAFNGGLIPTYLVVQGLGMVNTMWAIVIPGVVGAWSILVARTFFQQTIPDQLVEASKIDGASDIYLFIRV